MANNTGQMKYVNELTRFGRAQVVTDVREINQMVRQMVDSLDLASRNLDSLLKREDGSRSAAYDIMADIDNIAFLVMKYADAVAKAKEGTQADYEKYSMLDTMAREFDKMED